MYAYMCTFYIRTLTKPVNIVVATVSVVFAMPGYEPITFHARVLSDQIFFTSCDTRGRQPAPAPYPCEPAARI